MHGNRVSVYNARVSVEKPESEEFEEEDAEDVAPGGDDVDVDHIMRDVDSQRRRAPKGAEPAWRRLERVMEERRTAELMSDFDDYEIGAADGDDSDDSDPGETDDSGQEFAQEEENPQLTVSRPAASPGAKMCHTIFGVANRTIFTASDRTQSAAHAI